VLDAPLEGGLREKGKVGEALERALGATPGAGAAHDFPHLGIELKSIPVDEAGTPHESTHVASLRFAGADRLEWRTSWVRRKLARVLFVPIVGRKRGLAAARRIGSPLLWSPTPDQEDVLRADFDELVGLVGAGRVEDVTAHLGRWLQLRPKGASGRDRDVAVTGDEVAWAMRRGFYLRARFTGAILRDPAATPLD
jgi:DNA mismatch repair protein MutH